MPRLKGQNCRHGGACRYPICIPLPLPKLHPETATASHQSESKTEDNARLYNHTCRPGSRITSGTTVFRGKYPLTLRSAASRRVSPLKALHLQPLLRDGAIAPPQDENEAEGQTCNAITRHPLSVLRAFSALFAVNLYHLVTPAQTGTLSHKHQSRLPPWTPDHDRGDDVSTNAPSP